jgi:hypothetical protein
VLRSPITLWRTIFLDLLKLVGVTTLVLVLVIALGAAVKPLSDGVLSAGDLPKFVLIACVPMLAYALPFAGGFATTLVYYRIANENEATAAYASGISHRSLLAPALALALLLTGSLVLLNEQVIPVFLRTMQKLITVDVARQLLQGVARGEAVDFSTGIGGSDTRMMIYADSAQRVEQPTPGATDQIVFNNFAFVQTDKQGKPVQELSSRRAYLWLFPAAAENGEGQAQVVMLFENVVAFAERSGVLAVDSQSASFTIPNTFSEKVAFMSWRELRDLPEHPHRINWVEFHRQRLINALAERKLMQRLREAAATSQPIGFTDPSGRLVTVRAGSINGADGRWVLRSGVPGGAVDVSRVRTTTSGDSTQSITAETAVLARMQGPQGAPPTYELLLEKARVRDSAAIGETAATVERGMIPLRSLTPHPDPAAELRQLSTSALLEQADEWVKAGDTLGGSADLMREAIERLGRSIISKQNERMAMAASCAVMILTGAVTALLLSRRLPLTVYLWTFLPALATIVTISGGQQLVHQVGSSGLFLMWSGVGAFAVYTFVVYWWLAKH